MSRWRIVAVGVLFAIPFTVLAVLGSVSLWRQHLGLIVWWPLTFCFVLAYFLAWHWQRRRELLHPPDFAPPIHWTERDRLAWKRVEDRARAAGAIAPERLTDFPLYLDTAREMAQELARFYHPGAADPVANLTIPEILAVIELAAQDLAGVVDQYLPAGHLLTIQNWRRAKQASDWYRTLNNVYWIVSAVFSPVQTGLRYATTRLGMTAPWERFQESVILWFYTLYVHRVGTYLIDLNSGRLRVGARRYRELVRQRLDPATDGDVAAPVTSDPADQIHRVTLTIMGQVKAGKSSFINAVLGERRAVTDVLPATDKVTRYELQPPDIPTRLVLLDTVGYGHTGPREDQLRATEEAARQSDLLILVLHARNPARKADAEALRRLREWFATRPELRMPPILGVMTHVDLLSPALEWSPPYNAAEPTSAKEKSIAQALEAVRGQFRDSLVGVVPVCTAEGRVYGIEEWFLPVLAEMLDDAHAVALLRCLRAEADAAKIRRVMQQLLSAGKLALQLLWQLPLYGTQPTSFPPLPSAQDGARRANPSSPDDRGRE